MIAERCYDMNSIQIADAFQTHANTSVISTCLETRNLRRNGSREQSPHQVDVAVA